MKVRNSGILEITTENSFSNLQFPTYHLCHAVFVLNMIYGKDSIPAYLGWVFGQLQSLELHIQEFLHVKEQQVLNSFSAGKRRESFLLGRYAAKLSLAKANNISFKDIWIESGIFNHPLIHAPFCATQVSISHALQWGAALCFPDSFPMGIDIEKIDATHVEAIASFLSFDEQKMLKKLKKEKVFPHSENLFYALWTLKEALSKALRIGMLSSLAIYEIHELFFQGESMVCSFKNFPQFKGYSLRIDEWILSFVFPQQLYFNPDILIAKAKTFFEKCSC